MSIKAIRGFKDILPSDSQWWRQIEAAAVRIFSAFGFQELRIPVVEKTELFARSIGTDTDIVEKEMYSFPDRRGTSLTLRPEATAGVVRAVMEHSLAGDGRPLRLYSQGPMFRYERPQMGRQRQFHQINVEAFNMAEPLADAEIIILFATFLAEIGLADVIIHINSLGCTECRPAYKENLKAYLRDRLDVLCEDCKRRLDTNPLRILDCKVESCAAAVSDAPAILDTLCDDCQDHFDVVQKSIGDVDILVDPKLVRGLDYYNRTVFEGRAGSLGAQNAVGGGGRYDGLVKSLGGPDIPALGFAVGMERLAMLVAEGQEADPPAMDLFVVALDEGGLTLAFELVTKLKQAGIKADMDYHTPSMKSQMRRAGKLGAKKTLILGPDEIAKGSAVLRDMEQSVQEDIPIDGLFTKLAGMFKSKEI